MTRKRDVAVQGEPAIAEMQPQAGGSYVRDPATGALELIEGPEADEAPTEQQQAEPPQGDAGEVQQEA